MKQVVIYARYSSDNQREESIEGQIRDCKAYAQANHMHIVNIYIDRAFSARSDNRPEFQKMIKDSASKQFEAILVWKLDRFSRSRYDSAHYKHLLQKNNVKVISITEQIEDTPQGILMESLMEGMAEYYSVELAQKVRRGERENALKCMSNGGTIPLGYRVGKNKHFEIDEAAAPIVKELFQRFADGETLQEIVDSLNKRGVMLPNRKTISYQSFHRVLRNRKYLGEYHYMDIVIPGGMPKIIEEDVFQRVQERIAVNRKTPAKACAKTNYLLSGKVFCGSCLAPMRGECGRGRHGNTYYYYKCANNKKKEKTCKRKALKKDFLEMLVVHIVKDKVLKQEMIDRIAQSMITYQQMQDTTSSLEKQLHQIEKKINNILKAIEEGIFTPSTKERLQELEEQKQTLQDSIQHEKLKLCSITQEDIISYLMEIQRKVKNHELTDKKLIDLFVQAVYVYDKHIVVIMNGSPMKYTYDIEELQKKVNGSNLEHNGSALHGGFIPAGLFVHRSEHHAFQPPRPARL